MFKLPLKLFVFISLSILLGERSLGKNLEIHFLDVGYGDAIVIQLPEGGTVLVDSGIPEMGPFVLKMLQKMGVQEIDAFVITHFHKDHAGGVEKILSRFEHNPHREIKKNIVEFFSPIIPKKVEPEVQGTMESILKQHHQVLRRGDLIPISPSVKVEVLNPEKISGNPNEDSLVLKLKYGNVKILLAGDIGVEAQRKLVQIYGDRIKSDIIKIPHHGGDVIEEFVQRVGARDAVLSVGPNPYGLPKPGVLDIYRRVGSRVYRTDQHGNIRVSSDGKSYEIKTRRLP